MPSFSSFAGRGSGKGHFAVNDARASRHELSLQPKSSHNLRLTPLSPTMKRLKCHLSASSSRSPVSLLPAPAFAAEGLNGAQLSPLWALPFVGILLCIATGPVFYPHAWEHHIGKFTAFWSALIVIPLFATADIHTVTTTLAHTALLEYMPFILLLLALFTVAGGIYLEGNLHDSVFTNTVLLAIGAVLASIVGTTGASMILIRPLIRANDDRRYNAHVVVFFIFLVANIGGALSPLGDPPLFIGFLRGVDFFWTTQHLWLETLTVGGIVLAVFMVIDIYMHHREGRFTRMKDPTPDSPLRLHGKINLVLILIIIAAILMSAQWKPGIALPIAGVELQIQDLLRNAIFIVVTICFAGLDTQGASQSQRLRMGTDQRSGDPVRRHLHLHHPGDGDVAGRQPWAIRGTARPGHPRRRQQQQRRLLLVDRRTVVIPRQCADLSCVLPARGRRCANVDDSKCSDAGRDLRGRGLHGRQHLHRQCAEFHGLCHRAASRREHAELLRLHGLVGVGVDSDIHSGDVFVFPRVTRLHISFAQVASLTPRLPSLTNVPACRGTVAPA